MENTFVWIGASWGMRKAERDPGGCQMESVIAGIGCFRVTTPQCCFLSMLPQHHTSGVALPVQKTWPTWIRLQHWWRRHTHVKTLFSRENDANNPSRRCFYGSQLEQLLRLASSLSCPTRYQTVGWSARYVRMNVLWNKPPSQAQAVSILVPWIHKLR